MIRNPLLDKTNTRQDKYKTRQIQDKTNTRQIQDNSVKDT